MKKKWYAKVDVSEKLTGQWVKIGIIRRDDGKYDLVSSNGDDVSVCDGFWTIDGALNHIDRQWCGKVWRLNFI